MNGERRRQRAQIDKVQIERLSMGNERGCSDILQDHGWHEEVWIAWNDDFDGLQKVSLHRDLIAITVQQ